MATQGPVARFQAIWSSRLVVSYMRRRLIFRKILIPAFVLATAVPLIATSSIIHAQNTPPEGSKGVSRVVLGQGLPAAAPGEELSLRRVTFQPGARIPGEIHSGMQVVYVVSGTLGLVVKGGEGQVRRAAADGSQGPVKTVNASPTEVLLKAGDTILEPETLVLAPRNAGPEPLVILAASLLAVGKPQSVPITQNITINP